MLGLVVEWDSDMSLRWVMGVVKGAPLWVALPMEDRADRVPEIMDLSSGILSLDMLFKKHHPGIGPGTPKSTLEKTASDLREGLSERRKCGGPAGMRDSLADRMLCRFHSIQASP